MKKYLLPKCGSFYKANLHCHTTVSDGNLTPEQVKELYKSKGYSVVAYTDHDVLISHPELNDKDFIALNGYEMEVREGVVTDADRANYIANKNERKQCHMCFIAIEPDNLEMVCYNRENYCYFENVKYRDQVHYADHKPDYFRHYTPECISDMMVKGRENGYFVTYNHPAWSLEDFTQYTKYNGMHAMEICNYSCFKNGYDDYSPRVYDDMLRAGKRIFCIGADDNHNKFSVDSRMSDSGGAFTMIKAEKLEYKKITDALVKGEFYASQGPEIYELYYQDGKIYVKTSLADKIVLNTGRRRVQVAFDQDGTGVNSAVFDVFEGDNYVRITVTDHHGKHANTNAYFVDELLK